MLEMLQRLLGEQVTLRVELDPRGGLVGADSTALEQVLMNLAVNARDAMPDGGVLSVRSRLVEVNAAHALAHPGARSGPHLLLEVSDTGRGMASATIERLFEPFFTTKPRGEGTGLGLATVYGITDRAGGHIAVHSAPECGSRFDLYFPVVESGTGAAAVPTRSGALTSELGGSERILVVEDDTSLREVVLGILQRHGYEPLAAGDLTSALAQLRSARAAAPRLLLTDVILPGANGAEVATRLRERCPDLSVLFMSGYADVSSAKGGPLPQGAHFLQKPFTERQLLGHVRKALDESAGHQGSVVA
jgi:CheY-like chemotaxis protein